ncbi:MAG: esterase [Frankiales bacterium]|nr:esterase [Frankiales bacterium]
MTQHRSIWTTSAPGTALAVTALVVLVLVVVRTVLRRRAGLPPRLWRATAALAAALALSLLATAAYVNAYAGYLPTTGSLEQAIGLPVTDQGGSGSGLVSEVDVPAAALGVPQGRTFIYTPPGYRAGAGVRYPTLYLIHGSPGRAEDWFNAGGAAQVLDRLISAGVIPPLIVVAPSANAGFFGDTECLNAVGGRQLETYLTSSVVHFVDSHYPTKPGWSNRSIGGMSSGGFCALNLGLRHQALFGSVLAFEPYGDPGVVALGTLLHGNRTLYAANSPRSYLPGLRFQHPMQFFVNVGGASGHGVSTVRALAQQLRRRGQRTDFRVEPGQSHTWTEAAAGLPYALAFTFSLVHPPSPRVGPMVRHA